MMGVAVSSVDDVAAAFIARLGPVDAMKLQKLLYYAQGWHLAITGQPLFTDPIQAWRDGPVVPGVYSGHRGRRKVSSWPSGNPAALDKDSIQLLDLVCASYGELSGDDLSKLTHSEDPWLQARRGLGEDERGDELITYDAMRRYFTGRELAGFTSADLAVGGLGLDFLALPDASSCQRLEDVRSEFHAQPTEHPVDAYYGSSRARAGIRLPTETQALLAKRRARRGIN
jgi:uncharacterized phage-associated protein